MENTTTPKDPKEETHSLSQQMQDAEALTDELKRLLVRYESVLVAEGIRNDVETLERWMECYQHGLSAANNLSDKGIDWLLSLRDRLKLAADEMHRLEDEGGNPPNGEQAEKIEEMLKTVRRIDKVIPEIEQLFHHAERASEDA